MFISLNCGAGNTAKVGVAAQPLFAGRQDQGSCASRAEGRLPPAGSGPSSSGLTRRRGQPLGFSRRTSSVSIASRMPKGVVCLVSALAFHGLTDQLSRRVWMAIGKKDWASRSQRVCIRVARFRPCLEALTLNPSGLLSQRIPGGLAIDSGFVFRIAQHHYWLACIFAC